MGWSCLKRCIEAGDEIVLVSQGLEHVMRPLAQHLGVKWLVANRLEFRDGIATGRLAGTGDAAARTLRRHQRLRAGRQACRGATGARSGSARAWKRWSRRGSGSRQLPVLDRPIVYFDGVRQPGPLSVRRALAGKHVMLIGVTGFIGKVWLVNTLMELPEIGRIYLLIRRQKSNPARAALRKAGGGIAGLRSALCASRRRACRDFLRERVEVVEGDVSQPGLGLAPEVSAVVCRRIST